MTQSTSSRQPAARTPTDPRATASGARSRARGDQLKASVLGAALLGAAVLLQQIVLVPRRHALVRDSETSLQSLAVAFPRLTLGGFRGLLATYLWIQAENDKNDRKWVELETKYDIIGALQPYFISVYVFHAWNQAYNLSAQFHDNDAKYKWVLDGLAYLNKGEDYNPNTPDILVEQGHMYFLKLGGSYERIFYRQHWRDDISRFHEYNSSTLSKKNDRTEALKLVHEFVMRVGPENKEAASKTKDPAELQKLNIFHTAELPDPSEKTSKIGYGISIVDPTLFTHRADGKPAGDPMRFRWGLSPYYFAYVTYKRTIAAGPPSTTAMRVVDSWPAMSLRLWCRDDMYFSQQTMNALFGTDGEVESARPDDAARQEYITNKYSELEDCYRNVAMIAPRSLEEFEQHLLRYPMNKAIHRKHIKETKSYEVMGVAEHALLRALIQWQKDGRQLTPASRALFEAALPLYDNSIATALVWVDELYPVREGPGYNPERMESEKYVIALRARKRGIENILKLQPGETPDMSFLAEETVER
jgi:hypothetical protein